MSVLVNFQSGVPAGNHFYSRVAAQRICRSVRSLTLSFTPLPFRRYSGSLGVSAIIRSAASTGPQCIQSSGTPETPDDTRGDMSLAGAGTDCGGGDAVASTGCTNIRNCCSASA